MFVGVLFCCNTVNADDHIYKKSGASTFAISGALPGDCSQPICQHQEVVENPFQKGADKSIITCQEPTSIHVEYIEAGKTKKSLTELAMFDVNVTADARITRYRNNLYQVVIHEIDRVNYTEINGELEYLAAGSSCITLRIILPLSGDNWIWYPGFQIKELGRGWK